MRRVVPGLDAEAIRRQGEEIAAANEVLAPFRVLRGAECDILPDGSLDLPDDVLSELDGARRAALAELLPADGQAVVTATGAGALPVEPRQLLEVTPGKVTAR